MGRALFIDEMRIYFGVQPHTGAPRFDPIEVRFSSQITCNELNQTQPWAKNVEIQSLKWGPAVHDVDRADP
jgi:hypothetical protein